MKACVACGETVGISGKFCARCREQAESGAVSDDVVRETDARGDEPSAPGLERLDPILPDEDVET